MHVPPEVEALLSSCIEGVQRRLGKNVLGLYLRGSLATGGFDPATSDIDLACVTQRRIDEAEFEALSVWHEDLSREHRPWGWHLECVYFDREAARTFTPGELHATRARGEPLAWLPHEANWIFERATLHTHGRALLGPPATVWFPPLPPDELARAARQRAREWLVWSRHPDDPQVFGGRRRHQAYVFETLCRALHTAETGTLATKPDAVAWARENLPAAWRALADRSRSWRTDDTIDPAPAEEVAAFIRYVAERTGEPSMPNESTLPRPRPTAELEAGLEEVRRSPRAEGTLRLIVRRPEPEAREVVEAAELDAEVGLVGDCWKRRGNPKRPDGQAHPETQLTLMNARAAALIAGEEAHWPLAGDQLYVDFDLSSEHLPPGTRLTIGPAQVEVTPEPHAGCIKFVRRFGKDAMRFVNSTEGMAMRLRGVNTRVLRGGAIRVGDAIVKEPAEG